MRDGYCAGLVVSAEGGLKFPRPIVQIPGHRQFVVADTGRWNPDRQAASGPGRGFCRIDRRSAAPMERPRSWRSGRAASSNRFEPTSRAVNIAFRPVAGQTSILGACPRTSTIRTCIIAAWFHASGYGGSHFADFSRLDRTRLPKI